MLSFEKCLKIYLLKNSIVTIIDSKQFPLIIAHNQVSDGFKKKIFSAHVDFSDILKNSFHYLWTIATTVQY